MTRANVVAVVQVRLGSRRFPAKVLADLCGRPMLAVLLSRLRRALSIDRMVVALGEESDADGRRVVEEIAADEWADVFAPNIPVSDLLLRHVMCALEFQADYVVRVPSDNPLVCHEEVDRIVKAATANPDPGRTIEMWSNLEPIEGNGYPDGLGAEVYRLDGLRVVESLVSPAQSELREHPHSYFFATGLVRTIGSPVVFPASVRLDVNTAADLDFVRSIYAAASAIRLDFGLQEIHASLPASSFA